MSSALSDWLKTKPKGELGRMLLATKLSWTLLCRAKKGIKVRLEAAVLISNYTGGEVPVAELTDASPEVLAAATATLGAGSVEAHA